MPAPTECEGSWIDTYPRHGTDLVLRCSDCGEYWIISEDRTVSVTLPNPTITIQDDESLNPFSKPDTGETTT